MLLWVVLACLTAAVAALLLLPFWRAAPVAAETAQDPAPAGGAAAAGEVAVYRDQLRELDRDLAGGLISAAEAEYARAEIGRRLIAAANVADDKNDAGRPARPPGRHRLAGAVVTLVPPAIGLCLYLALGSPGMPDQPLAARLADPGNNVALLVAKAERHLAENPDDGAGWDLLAPIYFRAMRLGDAELAYRHAIRLLGPTPQRLAGLGEVMVAGNDGIVIEDARFAFEEVLRREPKNPRARFYVALAHEQAGRNGEAHAIYRDIAADSPPEAPWMQLVRQHIAKTAGAADAGSETAAPAARPPMPDAAAVESAAAMSAEDRREMIRGMVDGLAERLKQSPDDLAGWQRLVRSQLVLGERDAATATLREAITHFPDSVELAGLARQLGIATAPAAQQGATQ